MHPAEPPAPINSLSATHAAIRLAALHKLHDIMQRTDSDSEARRCAIAILKAPFIEQLDYPDRATGSPRSSAATCADLAANAQTPETLAAVSPTPEMSRHPQHPSAPTHPDGGESPGWHATHPNQHPEPTSHHTEHPLPPDPLLPIINRPAALLHAAAGAPP